MNYAELLAAIRWARLAYGKVGDIGTDWDHAHPLPSPADGFTATRGPLMVIALRGTQVHSLRDLFMDLRHWRRVQPEWAPEGVRLAKGSLDYVEHLYGDVAPRVKAFRKGLPDGKIEITGHSLGAGAAGTLAYRLAVDGLDADEVYSIEPPRVGNARAVLESTTLWRERGTKVYSVRAMSWSDELLAWIGDPVTILPPLPSELPRGLKWLGGRHLFTERVVIRLGRPGPVVTGEAADHAWARYKTALRERRWRNIWHRGRVGLQTHGIEDIEAAVGSR